MNSKKTWLFIVVSLILVLIGIGLYTFGLFPKSEDKEVQPIIKNETATHLDKDVYVQMNKYKSLQAKYNVLDSKLSDLQSAINKPAADLDSYSQKQKVVTASRLYIRQDPSMNLEPIGVLINNAIVNIIDNSNPLWVKISLDLKTQSLMITEEDDERHRKRIVDANGNNYCNINEKFLVNATLATGTEYYIYSKYVDDIENAYVVNENPKSPSNPFRYGLLFYNDDFATILKNEIWTSTSDRLIELGYDGIEVEYANRYDVVKHMQNGYFDIVETPPLESVEAIDSGAAYDPFLKIVNKTNNESVYAGIMVTNKQSGITSPEDIAGKRICFTSNSSASGFWMQRYYLDKYYGIDIFEDCEIVYKEDIYPEADYKKFSHNEIPLVVMNGFADVGFCGDFTMQTDTYAQYECYLKAIDSPYSALGIDNQQELDQIFQMKLDYLYLLEISTPLANNPHSIKKELLENSDFVETISAVIGDTYSKYNEEFGITISNVGEYNSAAELYEYKNDIENEEQDVE